MTAVKSLADAVLQYPIAVLTWTIVVAFVARFFWRGYQQRRFYRNLPGPPHSWLWGHLKIMGEVAALLPPNMHPQQMYTEIAKKHGLEGMFYMDLWPFAEGSLILHDPELMDQIQVTKPLPQHRLANDLLKPMVGDNVIAAANGAVWKRLHNAMLPAFSWSHIRHLTGMMVDECMIFRDILNRKAATGEVFSFEETSARLVFDVISRIVFAFPLHAQTTSGQELLDIRELIKLAEGQLDVFTRLNPFNMVRVWWRKRQVVGRLDPKLLSHVYERLKLLINEEMVPSRRNPYSILDLMLREHVEQNPEKGRTRNAKISKADEELLLTQIKGLLLGGHGTTTDTLTFLYMLLSKHPEVVQKIRQELIDVFGPDSLAAMEHVVEYPEKLQNLPYTEGAIKETLRLFPAGFGVRQAETGMTISYKGASYPIDNELVLSSNAHGVQWNSKYFPDPEEFRPERWIGENEAPRAYFRTFGKGARACLGQNLALNEIKIILMATVRDYDFECAGLKPNARPRLTHTRLDTIYGDVIFQELAMEPKPRGGGMMTVRKIA